jgi:site-specific DNA recombinase
MNIAIYSRKSKFTGKGESIENQIEMCKEYIDLHYPNEKHFISVFEDEGFSGKNLNRPQFQEMMSIENQKPFDLIVVYRLDRISRNVGDFATLVDKLNQKNTSFICIKEQFDTSTPMGRAMMNIASVFAQLERETIAERVKDNMYMLAKSGKWTGGTTPLGYKSVKVNNGDKSYFVLDFDENQIDLVKLIFNKYSEINSVNGVETYLRENGYKTQKGNEWNGSNLKRILINPIYCIADKDSIEYFTKLGSVVCFDLSDCNGENGILPYNRFAGQKRTIQSPEKWVITVSKHKGILTGKEWIRIQELIKQNSSNCFGGKPSTRRTINPKSILSGLLYCSCGAYMRPKIYPSGNMYYLCERKANTKKQECQVKNVNGDDLDKLILDEIFAYDVKERSVYNQLQALKGRINSINNELDVVISRLENKKAENAKRIKNLTYVISQSIEMGTAQEVINIYNEQINELIAENKNISIRINELLNSDFLRSEMTNNLNNISEAINYLRNNFDKLSIQNKREFMKKIIDKVIWDGNEAHIFIKGISD